MPIKPAKKYPTKVKPSAPDVQLPLAGSEKFVQQLEQCTGLRVNDWNTIMFPSEGVFKVTFSQRELSFGSWTSVCSITAHYTNGKTMLLMADIIAESITQVGPSSWVLVSVFSGEPRTLTAYNVQPLMS